MYGGNGRRGGSKNLVWFFFFLKNLINFKKIHKTEKRRETMIFHKAGPISNLVELDNKKAGFINIAKDNFSERTLSDSESP